VTLEQAWQCLAPPKVLLAEDDDEARTLLARALRQDGYRVREARDGHELLQEMGGAMLGHTEDPIDLVISDIRMPGPSGLAVLRSVRSADWAIPFILITAFGDEDTHREAERLGARAVFDKPFDVDDLRTAVLNTLPPDERAAQRTGRDAQGEKV
jgi:DNA-binding NtrC family response regulator